MIVDTPRLELIPLTAEQLFDWINDISKLEKELNCKYRAEPMTGVFLDIIKNQYQKTLTDSEHYLFHTFWLIVRKKDRIVVGSSDFKDLPDEKGCSEIGYGLGKEYEGHGYMTETVEYMCRWASSISEMNYVTAETEIDNKKSQNVLRRCNFSLFTQDSTYWWKRKV